MKEGYGDTIVRKDKEGKAGDEVVGECENRSLVIRDCRGENDDGETWRQMSE